MKDRTRASGRGKRIQLFRWLGNRSELLALFIWRVPVLSSLHVLGITKYFHDSAHTIARLELVRKVTRSGIPNSLTMDISSNEYRFSIPQTLLGETPSSFGSFNCMTPTGRLIVDVHNAFLCIPVAPSKAGTAA